MENEIMEEDRLSEVFSRFSPSMPSDEAFMARLERSLDAVGFIRRQSLQSRRRNRLAAVAAAIAGFLCGMVFSLCFPCLAASVRSLGALGVEMAEFVAAYGDMIVRAFICCVTTLFTYMAYGFTLFFAGRPVRPVG